MPLRVVAASEERCRHVGELLYKMSESEVQENQLLVPLHLSSLKSLVIFVSLR
jgi:hypothetical protein